MKRSALVRVNLPRLGMATCRVLALQRVPLEPGKGELRIVFDRNRLHAAFPAQLTQRQGRITGRRGQAPFQRRQPLFQLIHARRCGPHALPLIPSIEGIQHVLQ